MLCIASQQWHLGCIGDSIDVCGSCGSVLLIAASWHLRTWQPTQAINRLANLWATNIQQQAAHMECMTNIMILLRHNM